MCGVVNRAYYGFKVRRPWGWPDRLSSASASRRRSRRMHSAAEIPHQGLSKRVTRDLRLRDCCDH